MCTYSNIRPSYEPSEDLHQQHQGDNLGGQGMGRRPSMNDNNRDGGLSPYTSQYPHTQPQQMSQPYGQQLQLQQQGAMYQLAGSSPYSLQHGISGPNLGIVGVGGGYGVFDNMSQQHQNSSFNQQQMMQQQQQQRHGFGKFCYV